ncbi:hypothetical protein [Pseudomonas sp. PK-RTE-24]|jgi:hypothetical protein
MSFSGYREHPIHTTVRRFLELRDSPAFSINPVVFSEAHTYARNKIFAIAQTLQHLLKTTPEELTSLPGLYAINEALQQPLAELTVFLNDENVTRLENAAAIMENSILQGMWAFSPNVHATLVDVLPGLLQAQQKFAMDSVAQVADSSDSLAAHLVELDEETVVLQAKLVEITESANRERAEATAALAKLEHAFTVAEAARQVAFDEAQRINKIAVEEGIRDIRDQSEALILELEYKREQAAQIVQVVGNIGVTGNYQRIATTEAESANFWRWATVIIFGAGIAIALATFYKFWHEPFSQDTAVSVLIRLFYAIVITSPAVYTARESARHRTNADRARQTELELASIGPFIELLPEDSKVAIRTGLTSSYFGKATEAHTASSPLDPEHFKNLVEMLKAVKSK